MYKHKVKVYLPTISSPQHCTFNNLHTASTNAWPETYVALEKNPRSTEKNPRSIEKNLRGTDTKQTTSQFLNLPRILDSGERTRNNRIELVFFFVYVVSSHSSDQQVCAHVKRLRLIADEEWSRGGVCPLGFSVWTRRNWRNNWCYIWTGYRTNQSVQLLEWSSIERIRSQPWRRSWNRNAWLAVACWSSIPTTLPWPWTLSAGPSPAFYKSEPGKALLLSFSLTFLFIVFLPIDWTSISWGHCTLLL